MGETIDSVIRVCRDAAFGGGDFHTALRSIATFVGGDKAILLGKDRTASPTCNIAIGHDPEVLEAYQKHWRFSDPRRFHSFSTRVGEAALGQAYIANDELAHTEYFSRVAIEGDVADSVHGIVQDTAMTGRIALSVHRGFGREFFQAEEQRRMQAVLPLLRQTIEMSIRSAMLRGDGDPDAFCACIDRQMNLVPIGGSTRVADALGAQQHSLIADTEFSKALRIAVNQAQAGRTVKLRREHIGIEVSPSPRALDWMPNSESFAMLVAKPFDIRDEQAQLRLFALSNEFTPREIDVLLGYSQLCDVRRTAASLAMSYETARWHIKNMLGKCGRSSIDLMMKAARDGVIAK